MSFYDEFYLCLSRYSMIMALYTQWKPVVQIKSLQLCCGAVQRKRSCKLAAAALRSGNAGCGMEGKGWGTALALELLQSVINGLT